MNMRAIAITVLLLAGAGCVSTAPGPREFVPRLTEAVRAHCPEATIESTRDWLDARYHTRTYLLHQRLKVGEEKAATREEEGPEADGFRLQVTLRKGPSPGAEDLAQTRQGEYYPTYFDARSIRDGQKHYEIRFSFGPRVDPALKQAILDVIESTEFR
jgi:hypothetical protein